MLHAGPPQFRGPCLEQSVKNLPVVLLFAIAVPAFAGPNDKPVHERERFHEKVAVERANERQKEAVAKEIRAKIVERSKVNER
jgi:hypothetical protein